MKTACTYGVKYIITEKPKLFALPKIYENGQFILYRAPECRETGTSENGQTMLKDRHERATTHREGQ